MWPCRQFWFRGSREEYWLIGLMLFALPMCTISIVQDISKWQQIEINTVLGNIYIDRWAMGLKISRCYMFLFFSPSMRSACLSAFKVFMKLPSVISLIVVSFFMYYFFYLAIMNQNQMDQNLEAYPPIVGNRADGIWNFLILLTTANHPDILLQLYSKYQVTMFVLISFMLITFFFLLSLLLGVVFNAYREIYGSAISREKKMEQIILYTAFDLAKEKDPDNEEDEGMDFETWSEIASAYGDGKGSDDELIRVWFDMMDTDGSGYVGFEEFKEIKAVVNAPIIRRDVLAPRLVKEPLNPVMRKLFVTGNLTDICGIRAAFVPTQYDRDEQGQEIVDADGNKRVNYLGDTVSEIRMGPLSEWTKVEGVVTVAQSTAADRPEDITELQAWVDNIGLEPAQVKACQDAFQARGWKLVSDLSADKVEEVLDDPESFSVTETSARRVQKALEKGFRCSPGPYYTIEITSPSNFVNSSVSALDMRSSMWQYTHFYILSNLDWNSFVDMVTIWSVIWWIFTPPMDVCFEGYGLTFESIYVVIFILDVVFVAAGSAYKGNATKYFKSWYSWVDVITAFGLLISTCLCSGGSSQWNMGKQAFRSVVYALRCFRLTYCLEALAVLSNVTYNIVQLITPQLLLFVIQFYFFAVLGMAFFAGNTTEVTEDGGPGDWTSSPWDETSCGSTPYYYRLNFDSICYAFFTLFAVMVQNNWGVTVDCFSQANSTHRNVRFYFFAFYVCTVIITVNIFISTIILSFDYLLQMQTDKTISANKRHKATVKLHATIHTKRWTVNDALKDGRALFELGDEDHADEQARQEMQGKTTEQTRQIMTHCPIPMYITTSAGKFTFVNDNYLLLENIKWDSDSNNGDNPLIGKKDNPSQPNPVRMKLRAKEREATLKEGSYREHLAPEVFTLKLGHFGPQGEVELRVEREHQEEMVAFERPVKLLSGMPGTLVFFLPNSKEQVEKFKQTEGINEPLKKNITMADQM
jgi:hypothetical protein